MIILPEDSVMVELLSPEDAKALFLALLNGDDAGFNLSPAAKITFAAMIAKDKRISNYRSENGKKGGAPSGNSNASKNKLNKLNKLTQAKQASVSVSVSVPVTESDTVTDAKDTLGAKRAKRAQFQRPSLDEVRAYCDERKNNVNPQQFIDFYEAKGWMVGKNSMKDWKAAIRTWENNGFSNGSNGRSYGREPPNLDGLFDLYEKEEALNGAVRYN